MLKYKVIINTAVGSEVVASGTEHPGPDSKKYGLTDDLMEYLVKCKHAVRIETEEEKKLKVEKEKAEESGVNPNHLDAPKNFPARSLTSIRTEHTKMENAKELETVIEEPEVAEEKPKNEVSVVDVQEEPEVEKKKEKKTTSTAKKKGRPKSGSTKTGSVKKGSNKSKSK